MAAAMPPRALPPKAQLESIQRTPFDTPWGPPATSYQSRQIGIANRRALINRRRDHPVHDAENLEITATILAARPWGGDPPLFRLDVLRSRPFRPFANGKRHALALAQVVKPSADAA
jgi:hypothetical protein